MSHDNVLKSFENISSSFSQIKGKIFLTLLAVIIYRLGTYVPMPFVDPSIVADVFGKNAGSGFFGVANTVSGGALGRFSIFSLNVMPYILSSIVVQLYFSPMFSSDNEKADPANSSKISKYTKYATLIFGLAQALVVSFAIRSAYSSMAYLPFYKLIFVRCVMVSTLVCGTMFLIWLGELITSNGLGNGISVIIFVGIISELPKSLQSTLELERIGAYSGTFVFFIMLMFAALIFIVVFVERSYRKISVSYPKRNIANRVYEKQSSHIPIKINLVGVIPAIFASTVTNLPFSLSGLFLKNYPSLSNAILVFYSNKIIYYSIYLLLIIFFTFFYTTIVFDAKSISESMRKNGGFIIGRRPGKSTMEYLVSIVKKLTFIGAIYLSIICVAVDIFRVGYSIPFALGGTSMLIIVGVVTEIVSQIQMSAFNLKYDSLAKKMKLK